LISIKIDKKFTLEIQESVKPYQSAKKFSPLAKVKPFSELWLPSQFGEGPGMGF
jgi:hypothetical protein